MQSQTRSTIQSNFPGTFYGIDEEHVVISIDTITKIEDGLAGAVARLLEAATNTIARDRRSARIYLSQATALIDAEERAACDPSEDARAVQGRLAPWQVAKVTRYVEQHLSDHIPSEKLAAVAKLSSSYFFRAFRGSFGQSPHSFVMKRRMERAKEMMLATNEPLSQIALACGLADQAHLSRLFKEYSGMTPRTWRTARRAEA